MGGTSLSTKLSPVAVEAVVAAEDTVVEAAVEDTVGVVVDMAVEVVVTEAVEVDMVVVEGMETGGTEEIFMDPDPDLDSSLLYYAMF